MMRIMDLPEDARWKLLDSVVHSFDPRSTERMEHARLRYLLLRDDYSEYVMRWVVDFYRDPDLQSEIIRHILPLHNAFKRACNNLAVAYKIRPKRTVGGKTDTKKWTDFLRKTMYDVHWSIANRDAIGLNTIILLPRMVTDEEGDPEFEFTVVTGAASQIVRSKTSSIFAAPDILVYRVGVESSFREGLSLKNTQVASVDHEEFILWEGREIVNREAHGLGAFPGVVVRNTIPNDGVDWWDPWPNKGVVQCVGVVHRLVAEMNLWRRSHKGAVPFITSQDPDVSGVEGVSMADPEKIHRITGSGVDVRMIDLETDVDGFEKHWQILQDEGMEQMTGSIARVVDPDPSQPLIGELASRQWNAINQHRVMQTRFLERSDLRMQYLMASMLDRVGKAIVSPSKVKDTAKIEYAPIPLQMDEAERLKFYSDGTKFGVMDQVAYRMELTGETSDEAEAAIMEIADRRTRLHKVLATHNMPSDPGDEPANSEADPAMAGERPEAATGRFGGRAPKPKNPE